GQQFVEPIGWISIDHALEHIAQVGVGSRAYTQSRPVLVRPRPGSSTGTGVSSANRWSDAKTFAHSLSYSASSHQHAPPTHPASVERSSSTPWRAKICDCRYSGVCSQYLLTRTCASSAGVAKPPAIGRSGAGAWRTVPQMR